MERHLKKVYYSVFGIIFLLTIYHQVLPDSSKAKKTFDPYIPSERVIDLPLTWIYEAYDAVVDFFSATSDASSPSNSRSDRNQSSTSSKSSLISYSQDRAYREQIKKAISQVATLSCTYKFNSQALANCYHTHISKYNRQLNTTREYVRGDLQRRYSKYNFINYAINYIHIEDLNENRDHIGLPGEDYTVYVGYRVNYRLKNKRQTESDNVKVRYGFIVKPRVAIVSMEEV